MANPPPIPPPPAGYWRRTFACLADIIPLIILGWVLARWIAGPDELAALKTTEAWIKNFSNLYAHALETGSQREMQTLMNLALHPQTQDMEAIVQWNEFQGGVLFILLLCGLTLQEWLGQGRTLGKRMFHLRTMDVVSQTPPTFMGCLLRCAWKAAFFALPNPITMILGIINFHVPLFRRDCRTWHDLWSRTQVVIVP